MRSSEGDGCVSHFLFLFTSDAFILAAAPQASLLSCQAAVTTAIQGDPSHIPDLVFLKKNHKEIWFSALLCRNREILSGVQEASSQIRFWALRAHRFPFSILYGHVLSENDSLVFCASAPPKDIFFCYSVSLQQQECSQHFITLQCLYIPYNITYHIKAKCIIHKNNSIAPNHQR